ncbi:MAG: mechanosensitive ion channel family protein [Acidobacteria bacterium]|nr:mechanosensitive ion channel family protein [Acidobacteriota bacterium]MBI3423868.1 mechanosensitive ion channel family protein [Acidobacteriota bacterium]
MNNEIPVIILLAVFTGVLAWMAHWLIGVARRRLQRRFALLETQPDEPNSLRDFLLEWGGNALRTTVWVLYALFIIFLLPQTRSRIETLSERLELIRAHAGTWLFDTGVNLAIDVVATIFLARFATALIRTGFKLFERRAIERGETTANRRAQTLSAIFRGVAQTVIFFIGLLAVLQHLDVNVTPILASAGVIGIAVGFGAQSLIKDFFAGFMILLEDQYNVGDTIKVGETSGTVERLTLRMTLVRALDGSLTTIPNGTIATVSNFSKDWSRAVLDFEVDYTEDIDRAMKAMLATAHQMRTERPTDLIEEPLMLGVERLTHTSIGLRLTAKTAANKQAEIARELRRRIKLAFDELDIKAPTREQFVLAPGKEETPVGDKKRPA